MAQEAAFNPVENDENMAISHVNIMHTQKAMQLVVYQKLLPPYVRLQSS